MTTIFIKTQFVAFHRWKHAPYGYAFLRNWHRHVFHVKVTMPVKHNNRDIEFFCLKDKVDEFCKHEFCNQSLEFSCEQMAHKILVHCRADAVEVSEDGENGAIVERARGVELVKKSECFVGTEIEGPNIGARVFFIPGRLSGSYIAAKWKQIAKPREIERIYYGAGNDLSLSYGGMMAVSTIAKKYKIPFDVETEFEGTVFDQVKKFKWKNLGNVIQLSTKDTQFPNRQKLFYKYIHNDIVTWVDHKGNFYQTWLGDPTYDQDKEI